MSVKGVNSRTAYTTNQAGVTTETKVDSATEQTEKSTSTSNSSSSNNADIAATYEKSDNSQKTTTTYKPNTELVNKLKSELDARTNQLKGLVEKMLLKQGTTYNNSMDMFQLLKSGKLQVDNETRLQAQKDISEDGYWGVEQTSDRLVSFATALTGGDPSKADLMIKAVEKGFRQATKAWGGELPSICQKTLDATREKLNKWKNSLTTPDSTTSPTENTEKTTTK